MKSLVVTVSPVHSVEEAVSVVVVAEKWDVPIAVDKVWITRGSCG